MTNPWDQQQNNPKANYKSALNKEKKPKHFGLLPSAIIIVIASYIIIKLLSNIDYSTPSATQKKDEDTVVTAKFSSMNECVKSTFKYLDKKGLKYKIIWNKPKNVTVSIFHPDGSEIKDIYNSFVCEQKESGTEGIYYEAMIFLPAEYKD